MYNVSQPGGVCVDVGSIRVSPIQTESSVPLFLLRGPRC